MRHAELTRSLVQQSKRRLGDIFLQYILWQPILTPLGTSKYRAGPAPASPPVYRTNSSMRAKRLLPLSSSPFYPHRMRREQNRGYALKRTKSHRALPHVRPLLVASLPVVVVLLLGHRLLPRQQRVRQAARQARRGRVAPAAVRAAVEAHARVARLRWRRRLAPCGGSLGRGLGCRWLRLAVCDRGWWRGPRCRCWCLCLFLHVGCGDPCLAL